MLSLIFWEARKTKAGKAGLGQPTIQPKVIPIKYGEGNQHELGNEGLFLKNVGEPAVDVVVHLSLGRARSRFQAQRSHTSTQATRAFSP